MKVNGVELIEKNDMVCRASKGGEFEIESYNEWISAQKKDCVSIDIGAYTGIYAIGAALHGFDCIAVEPNNKVRGRLIENIELNKVDVEVCHYAMSYTEELRGLSLKPSTELTSSGTLFQGARHTQTVHTTTIDRYTYAEISVIKIDVEGWEQNVLFGAIQTLKRCKPTVIVEVLGNQEGVVNIMKMAGYTGDYKVLDGRNLLFK